MIQKLKVPEVSLITRKAEIKSQEISEILEYNKRKKSPYRKWVQMNNDIDAQDADDWLVANSPSAYRIFKFLVANMDKYNALICSYKVMQEKFGYSRATISEAIKLLKEHKFIQVIRTGGSNIYMINKELYWKSWGNNYDYAEFGAKVIVSSSEQEKEVQEEVKTQVKRYSEIVIKK